MSAAEAGAGAGGTVLPTHDQEVTVEHLLRPLRTASAALHASLATVEAEICAAAAAALRGAAAGRDAAEKRALAAEREALSLRAAAAAERAEHATSLERAQMQAADERSRLLHELEAACATATQLRGADLEAASLRAALAAAEGRAATALASAAAAAAALAALEAKHAESRSNYHRLYRKVMAAAPELLLVSQSRGAGGAHLAPGAPSPAPTPFQPLLSRVEAALPGLLPSPPPARRPTAAPPAVLDSAAAMPPPPPAVAAAVAVAAAPAARAPPPPAFDTVESDWVIRSTPDEQLQPLATADAAAAVASAGAAVAPETNGEEDADAPWSRDGGGVGGAGDGDGDAAPGSEVTQCCAVAARGGACMHRQRSAATWGLPVPVAAPPKAPVIAEKPWRKRGAAAAGGFLTDAAAPAIAAKPQPNKKQKQKQKDAPAPAAAAAADVDVDVDVDPRYLFTPPPGEEDDDDDDALAASPVAAARPPVALRDCSPLALPSPPRGTRTVWTVDPAAPPRRSSSAERRRARPAQERPAPPGGRYAEVERSRQARAAMPAFECAECRGFYAAMGRPAPPCTHSSDGGGAGGAAPRAPISHEERLKDVGRHRAQWAPALTPEGFWDIGFQDDPVPPPPEERARVTLPINFCPGLL